MIFNIGVCLVLFGQMLGGFFSQVTVKTSFSCVNRASGYYADMETGCQVYHMCDGLGRQFSYSCPNTTLFQQRMLICDHWYMVNCNKSEEDYTANLLIGQRDKPFVDESETNLYLRTPRPDFLTNTRLPEYNVIYRNGKSQHNAFSIGNLAGQSKGLKDDLNLANEPRGSSVHSSNSENEIEKYEQKPKYFGSSADNNAKPNDAFKPFNTLPTFKPKINTPITSRENFVSSELSNNVNHLPKQSSSIPFSTRKIDVSSSIPNKPLQPASNEPTALFLRKFKNNEKTLKELQEFFLIPDYQFPLETVYRQGYENGKSSFQNTPNLSADN